MTRGRNFSIVTPFEQKIASEKPWGSMTPKTRLACLSLCRKLIVMVDNGEALERRLGLYKVLETPMRHHHEIMSNLLTVATSGKNKYKTLKLLNQAQAFVRTRKTTERPCDVAKDDRKFLGLITIKNRF